MKIVKLAFENINSLKGAHVIDFRDGLLSKAGLFLISGPTGSGKSTILDAITLALFNKIPRFNSSISIREIDRSGSIVTHFTKSARASLTYESDGVEYNSTWSIAKNRNDNWNDYHMEIYRVEDKQIMDLKKSEVPKMNEQLIGLNYDQFLKSILLSQGEFAQFLQADSNVRGALLEKLTGTELYRKIGSLAYDRFKEEKEQIQFDLNQIESIDILDEDKVEEKDIQFKSLLKEANIKEQERNKLQTHLQLKLEIATIEIERQKTKKDIVALQDSIASFKESQNKLEYNQKLIPLKSELSIFEAKTSDLEEYKLNQRKVSDEISVAKNTLNESIFSLSKIVNKTITKETFNTEIKNLERKYNELVTRINLLEDQGRSVRLKINTQIDGLDLLSTKEPPETAIKVIDDVLAQFSQTKSELLKGKLSIEDEIDKIKEEKDGVQILISNDTKIQSLRNETHLNVEKIELLKAKNETEKRQLTDTNKKLHNQKSELESIEKEFTEFQKTINLTSLRSALTIGEPCPLCGSKEHPYADDHVIFEEGKYSIKIRSLKEAIHTKEKIVGDLAILTAKQNVMIEQLQKENNHKKEQINEILEESNFPPKWKVNDAQSQLDQLLIKLESLKKLYKTAEEAKILNGIRPLYIDLKELLTSHQVLFEELKSIYSGEDFLHRLNSIQDRFNSSMSTMDSNHKLLETIVQQIKKTEVLIDHKKSILGPQLMDLGIDHIHQAISLLLTEEEYNKLKTKSDLLWKEEIRLTTQMEQIQQKLNDLNSKDKSQYSIEQIQEMITQLETVRNKLNQEIGSLKQELSKNKENIELRNQKEKKLESKKKEFEKWQTLNSLIGDATGNKFANFAQDLTLKTLIAITNKNLKLLNERYVMVSTSITEGLFVYDTYQGDTVRSISTLSGGETFIVSLAMAISLSELASRNVKIESIFIDEGFGSLDAESLEQAIIALESFQAYHNKTIGIISHVDSLKERINTKIQLHKNNRGYSTIQIVA